MRVALLAGVLAVLGGCGVGAANLDAAAATRDASAGDASTVETEWVIDVDQTRVVDAVVTVTGGVFVVAQPDLLFVDDGGNLVKRVPMPDDVSEVWQVTGAPNDDVLVRFATTSGGLLVRYHAPSIEPRWAWTFEAPTSLFITATDEGAEIVGRDDQDPAWTVDDIDGVGDSVARTATGFERGLGGGPMWRLPDGSLTSIGWEDDVLRQLTFDSATTTFNLAEVPFVSDAVTGWKTTITSGVFVGSIVPFDSSHRSLVFAFDEAGETLIPVTATDPGFATGQIALVDDELLSLAGSTLYRAPLPALDAVERYELPARSDSSVQDSVLHGSGDGRVFAAWMDERSTFDVVLRVVRLR